MKPALRIAALAGLATLTGCTQPLTRVQLLPGTCGGVDRRAEVRVRVLHLEGEGLTPSTLVLGAEGSADTQALLVPPGTRRRLELRAYDGDPNGTGRLLLLGRSEYFDVAAGELEQTVRLVPRPVDVFVPLCTPQGERRPLGAPRAGHTATALPDGRIFVAGGYVLGANGQTLTSGTSELLDVAAGTSSPSLPLASSGVGGSSASPRAFHAATLFGGKVVLLGGESAAPDGAVTPLANALVADVTTGGMAGVQLALARSGGVVVTAGERLLLVGGMGPSGPTPEPEQLRADLSSSRVSAPLARAGATAYPHAGGAVVVGGHDGQKVSADVQRLVPQADRFTLQPATTLARARAEALCAPVGDERHVLVLGGRGAITARPLAPVNEAELLVAKGETVEARAAAFTRARTGGCAVTLEDGRVLWVGGREVGAGEATVSSAAVERLQLQADEKVTVEALVGLEVPRHQLACLRLPDGSVLALGGVSQTAQGTQVLSEALVLMPGLP